MKQIFEWIGKAFVAVCIGLIVRWIFDSTGLNETIGAQFSGMAICICMYETGLIKLWRDA